MKNEGSCSRKRRKVARIDDQDKGNSVDRISGLCDDILIFIISRLSLREATATSILSSRWRHLYTYTSRLDFPPFKPYIDAPQQTYISCLDYPERDRPRVYDPEQYREGKPLPKNTNYISMINSIFDSHKVCRVLKEFTIHMPFMEGADIEKWLEFALTRKVAIIDINILCLDHLTYRDVRREYFTLGLSNLIENKGLQCLKSVKKISLSNVQVDDEEVRLLVANSPHLESLSLSHSLRLRNVLISAPHSPISHLDISHSYNVESIQVCDMISLVSLRCYQLVTLRSLKVSNFSKVTELNITETYNYTLSEILANNIPSDQLQLLKLQTLPSLKLRATYEIPELINIKHLELEVDMPGYTLAHFHLIEACPAVEKVEIKFLWGRVWNKNDQTLWWNFEDDDDWTPRPKKKLSPYLKELKLSGYLGFYYETRLAQFIVKNVVGLEKLIVEPCSITRNTRRQATARVYRQLRPMISDSVDLVVII